MHEVVLYTKAGCPLCDHAKDAILGVRREVDFGFREVDITTDDELFDEHRYDVPVVEVDGQRAFKHRVDPRALLKRLSS
jgi:glutaredoxin